MAGRPSLSEILAILDREEIFYEVTSSFAVHTVSISIPRVTGSASIRSFSGTPSSRAVSQPRQPSPSPQASVSVPVGAASSDEEELRRLYDSLPSAIQAHAEGLEAGACRLSPQQRIARAYRAGCSARLKLTGARSHVDATSALDLRSRVYIVLRGPSTTEPTVVDSYSEYKKLVCGEGTRFVDSSVSHSFPSRAEAKAYCAGAQCIWPTRSTTSGPQEPEAGGARATPEAGSTAN